MIIYAQEVVTEREPASPGREPRETTSEPLLTCYSFEKRLNYSCHGGGCMEIMVSFINVMFIGWMWDRIRRLEKAVIRIDSKALNDVKTEEASRNYW